MLLFIPILILLHTFMPEEDDILHRNLVTKVGKFVDPINAFNVNIIKGIYWEQNFTMPIRQIVPKKAKKAVKFFGQSIVRESYKYYQFHNAYFSQHGITQGTYRFDFCRIYAGFNKRLFENPRPWEYYDKVVLGFSFHKEFGHFLSDMLCGLIQIPEEDVKDAHIFIPFNERTSKEFCKYMGFDPDRVHFLDEYYTYANQISVYVTDEGINAFWVRGFKRLRDRLHQNLNLSQIKPTRYVFLNRLPNLMRRLNNIDELVAFTKNKYPQYNWEVADPAVVHNIVENSRLMASTLYLVTTGGSNNFNGIFMHRDTYVVIAASNYLDYPNLAVYTEMDIWAIYANGGLKHGKVDAKQMFPVKVLDEALEIMFYVKEHNNWPEKAAANYLYCWSYLDNIQRAKEKTDYGGRLGILQDYRNRLIQY